MNVPLNLLYVSKEQRDELPFISLLVWKIALKPFISYHFSYEKLEETKHEVLFAFRLTEMSFNYNDLSFSRFPTDSWRSLKSPCTSFTMQSLQPKIRIPPGKRPYTRWSVNWTATSQKSSRRLRIYRLLWRNERVNCSFILEVTWHYYFISSCSEFLWVDM